MFGKSWLLPLLLVGAAAGPYFYSQGRQIFTSGTNTRQDPPEKPSADAEKNPSADGTPSSPHDPTRFSAPGIREAISLDVTPQWVLHRWHRVSTGLSDLDLQGYRVALTTGTRQSDLAGSLTYYFDQEWRVRKLTFFGRTGDPRELVYLLTGQFGFQPAEKEQPGMDVYQIRSGGKVVSELRIQAARVVRREDPLSRYEVALVWAKPGKYPLLSRLWESGEKPQRIPPVQPP